MTPRLMRKLRQIVAERGIELTPDELRAVRLPIDRIVDPDRDWFIFPGLVEDAYAIATDRTQPVPLRWYTAEQLEKLKDMYAEDWRWKNSSCVEFRCMGYDAFEAFIRAPGRVERTAIASAATLGGFNQCDVQLDDDDEWWR